MAPGTISEYDASSSVEDPASTSKELFVTTSTRCTEPVSPSRDRIESFVVIPPKSFPGVNEETFSMNGKGEFVVNVPGGIYYSQLRRTKLLHLEHWLDSEKIAAERSICGDQKTSSISRFKGEN